jgi:hypothetical protein
VEPLQNVRKLVSVLGVSNLFARFTVCCFGYAAGGTLFSSDKVSAKARTEDISYVQVAWSNKA